MADQTYRPSNGVIAAVVLLILIAAVTLFVNSRSAKSISTLDPALQDALDRDAQKVRYPR